MFLYTVNDFKQYLDENNIPYTPRKDGYPNMSYKNMRSLYNNHKKIKETEYYKKKSLTRVKQDKTEMNKCFICYDNMESGVVNLKCGHSLCASCFASHMREQNNCPFCREEICSKPKKIIKMPQAMFDNIIEINNERKYFQRENMNIKDYINNLINNFITHFNLDNEQLMLYNQQKTILRFKITQEIKEIMRDVIHDTETYYLSFM